jgi:hypothetical protein
MARELVKTFKPDQPLGTVIQSLLTEAEFQAIHGNNWVLMDGRPVIGTDYQLLDPGNPSRVVIPDARGQFLRGLDPSGSVDPDGASRSLGGSQADAFQGHQHENGAIGGSSPGGIASGGGRSLFDTGIAKELANGIPRTSDETRPKNITVNYFIKINNEAT